MARGTAQCIASCEIPDCVLEFSQDTLPIFALEFYAIALAIFERKDILRNATTALYTDNTGAFGAVLSTGSSSASVSMVTMRLWYLVDQFYISAWLEAVPSDLNIADLPTRCKLPPIKGNAYSNFTSFAEAFAFFTQCPMVQFLAYFSARKNDYEGILGIMKPYII